jgi:hypothetical protein
LIELIDELPENLFAEMGGVFLIIEENDTAEELLLF